MEQRRLAGLCFKCGNKYHAGHICPDKTLNVLQAHEEVAEIYDEDCWHKMEAEDNPASDEVCEPQEAEEMQERGVSVHALNGERQQDTIKIQGETKGKTLTVLIDTGSTHSFIDIQVAREVKATVEAAASLTVTVANGQKVLSKLRCPGFTWSMQEQQFKMDLRVIRLEGSILVLGIDWLKSYGKVTFDFQQNAVTLCKDGAALTLKGIEEGAKLKLITAAQCYQEVINGACCLISQMEQIERTQETGHSSIHTTST
uniref:Uncharacterized protein n=1 Tax=Ananas comosus var. bracteatus TaxID=296719 RepID=A0A6V7PA48_ANACO|nr:unnamed protein product [Ananas comosus var. bracteatus]